MSTIKHYKVKCIFFKRYNLGVSKHGEGVEAYRMKEICGYIICKDSSYSDYDVYEDVSGTNLIASVPVKSFKNAQKKKPPVQTFILDVLDKYINIDNNRKPKTWEKNGKLF